MSSKRIAKNFLSLFLSSAFGQLLTLWAFVYIARVCGPEGFGKFAFAQVVSLYFLHLAEFGLQTFGTRTIAQERTSISKHVLNITILRAFLAVGCFALLVLFAYVIPKPSDVQFLTIIFGLSLLPSAVLFEWVFQGVEQMEYVGVARVLKGFVFATLVFFFVHGSNQLNLAAVFYIIGITVSAGALLFAFYSRFALHFEKTNFRVLKEIFLSAIPLATGSFIAQVNYNFGTLALGFFFTSEVVGLFSAAHKIVLFIWVFAVMAASTAIFPLLARSYTLSLLQFSSSLKKLLRLFAIVAIPIGVGGSILASRIMDFLFSAEYSKSVLVFQISIWIVVTVIYRVIFENALIASRKQRDLFFGYLLSGSFTILGNLLLIPHLGLIAPSVIGICAEFVLLGFFVHSCKFIRLSYAIEVTLKPLLAGLIMGLALVFLPFDLFTLLGIGILMYFVLLLLLRGITLEEIIGYFGSLAHQ